MIKLFGFKIGKDDVMEVEDPNQRSFTLPNEALDDGAVTVTQNAYFGTYVDLEGSVRNELELITRYREMANHPELEAAIDDIVNEAITHEDDGTVVDINLDKLKLPDNIKKKIHEEFYTILKLLNFSNLADDLFKRWYIDGRIYFHILVNDKNPKEGIQELRYIDPRKIRKIREINKDRDPITGANVIKSMAEYYIYNDKGTSTQTYTAGTTQGVKIAPDSIINVNSGLMDAKNTFVISYLHKCIRTLNMLRMIEDAIVVYRVCLVGETRVKTNNGYKYIKDISPGDIVYSFNANGIFEAPVKSVWSNGVKDVFTVKSKHHSITGTANHPILVFDKNTNIVEYVDIDKLDIRKHQFVWETTSSNEKIPIPKIHNDAIKLLNHNIWADYVIDNKDDILRNLATKLNIKFSSVRNFLYGQQYLNKSDAEKIINEFNFSEEPKFDQKIEGFCTNLTNLPKFVDTTFARLFGFLIGDGTVRKNGITFAEGTHEDVNKFYSEVLKEYFGNCKKHPTKRKFGNYTTNSTLGADILREMGWITGAKNKRIPDWVFKASDDIKKEFILGLSDADGAEKYNPITDLWSSEIVLCNKKLVEDIKEIWTSLGYASGHIRYSKRLSEIRIVGDETEPRVMPETESWAVYISNRPIQRFEKIISIESAGQEEVFDMEVDSEKHNFVANGIVVHNSRAPERRVFYIDVGNLPKGKAEQYLRDVMVKYRNKMVYDPQSGSMRNDIKHISMLEDYFLPRREGSRGTEITTLPAGCLSMDTKIPLLDGRELTITEISNELETNKDLWSYSCDPITGEFAPGLISWAGVTQESAKVMKITFDNDESVVCTLDHKFPVWNKGFVEAKDLVISESMIPFYTKKQNINRTSPYKYQQIFENKTKEWKFTHRLVSTWKDSVGLENEYFFDESFRSAKKATVHHKNGKLNNNPNCLVRMHFKDHIMYHGSLTKNFEDDHFIKMNKLANESRWNSEESKHNRKKLSESQTIIYPQETQELIEFCAKNNLSKANSVEFLNKNIDVLAWQNINEDKRIKNREIINGFIFKDLTRFSNRNGFVGWTEYREFYNPKPKLEEKVPYNPGEMNKIKYPDYFQDLIKECATLNLNTKKSIDYISNKINYDEWESINSDLRLVKRPSLDKFSEKDFYRFLHNAGFNNWKVYKDTLSHTNHKIVKIEYLDEPISVGTLTIDVDEIYHNYHTFALSCGVYTKNSNLGETGDVDYFKKKLLQALNVPYSRMEPDGGGFASMGKSAEITRDELKFAKFITRLRNKFSQIFDHALRVQLSLKGICSLEEWDDFKEDIYFDFRKDNNFTELRESELIRERLITLQQVDPYIGRYFSQTWIKKNVLRMSDEEIADMDKEMEKDGSLEIMQQQIDAQNPGMQQPPEPIDNTYDRDAIESMTPHLDKQVSNFPK